jgi:hypothetical protein
MRPHIGQVIGCRTRDVANHVELFKWHLCICDIEGLHLYVCEMQYPDDPIITWYDCPGLEFDESFISVSRIIVRQKFPNDSRIACQVDDNFLRSLSHHIDHSYSIKDATKRRMLGGINMHLE